MKAINLNVASLAIVAACVAGCGSNDNSSDSSDGAGGPPSGYSADVLMAQDSAQSGDDAGSTDDTTNGAGPQAAPFMFADDMVHSLFGTSDYPINANVSIYSCTGVITGAAGENANSVWVANANLTFDPAACTGARKLTGEISVAATWSNAQDLNARTADVTVDLTTQLADGSKVEISSLDPSLGYTAQLQGTGSPRNGNTQVVATLNEHRVLLGPNGTKLYDHNVTSPTPVTIATSYGLVHGAAGPTSRTLVSGTVEVHHNLAKFSAQHKFQNVVHDLTGNCYCPSSGTIEQDVTLDSNKGTYTRTYAFTGCGVATVTTSASTLDGTANGSATVTFNGCTQ